MYYSGISNPIDTPEHIGVSLCVEDGIITDCTFSCEGCRELQSCGETLCRILPGIPAADVLQMTNMAIVYQLPEPLPPLRFYCSAMAAQAAKDAVRRYCEANAVAYDRCAFCHCDNRNETQKNRNEK